MRRGLLFSLVLLLCAAPTVSAQVPAGSEFRVNTYATSIQSEPSVAADAGGNFVVVWTSYGQDGSFSSIFGQRYSASGAPAGSEFRVNTSTPSRQFGPSVAADAAGNLVVVWASFGQDGSYTGVFGQRYDASGAPAGSEFQVNTYTTREQTGPSVAADAAGNFVVVWTSYGQDSSPRGVFGQRYDASGAAAGSEFRVNTYTTSAQRAPSVAADVAGNFVVVWESEGQDGSSYGVFGQRYDASGAPAGSEFRVNTYTTNFQQLPSVAADAAGNFVVVWQSYGQEPSGYGVFGQRYDASGASASSEFRVNTYTTSHQFAPSVAADAAGNFVVVWESQGQDGSGWGVFGQRFDASGAPAGSEFRVNTYTTNGQRQPSVAADAAGNFVVVWNSDGQDGSGFGVFGQRYGGLLPSALAVDASPSGLSDGNGVFEWGESVVVVPSWRNVNGADQTFTGAASSFTGPGTPGNPNYVLVDGMGDYGTVADGATGSCGSNCYAVGVSVPSVRPARHWDASVREDILPVALGQSKTWTLHVGDSFPDVPRSHLFYRFIETIFHHGVTSGCSATDYCPSNSVTRGQMAKLLLTSKLGSAYTPPPCQGVFTDVTCPSPFADWIEDLYGRGITQGCGTNPLRYCPASAVSRRQMAVLLLKTLLGPSYTPPTCAGIFADVTCPSLFADWIEDLYGRNITSGCGTNPLRYCSGSAVKRGQMAAFLTRTFGLKLYGP